MHRFEAILRSPKGSGKPWDEVLDESASFVSFPSLGSMVAGWLLIMPRRPVLNLRNLTSSEQDELDGLINRVGAKLGAFPGTLYAFEHGNEMVGGPVGCGVDQAHLHLVPLSFDLFAAAREWPDDNMQWAEIGDAATFASVIPTRGEYVSIWRPSDQTGLVGTMLKPQSQWVRRVIAAMLGREEAWDYKAHPDVENLMKTVEVIRMGCPKKSLNQR